MFRYWTKTVKLAPEQSILAIHRGSLVSLCKIGILINQQIHIQCKESKNLHMVMVSFYWLTPLRVFIIHIITWQADSILFCRDRISLIKIKDYFLIGFCMQMRRELDIRDLPKRYTMNSFNIVGLFLLTTLLHDVVRIYIFSQEIEFMVYPNQKYWKAPLS